MTMAHIDSVKAIVQSSSAEALSDACLVDGDGGRVGVESALTWSP